MKSGFTRSASISIAIDIGCFVAGLTIAVARARADWGEAALAAGLCALGLVNLWGWLADRKRAARGKVFFDQDGLRVELSWPELVSREPRRPAKALGIVKISEDFDAPLPADVQAEFER